MADEKGLGGWPVEVIPDCDRLYMRVHQTWFKRTGEIGTGAFQIHGGGMSTDWCKYSTPRQTRERARTPRENAIVEMVVADVRAVPGQGVEHRPQPENRAHTDVIGQKDEEARVLLRRISKLVLSLQAE